MPGHDGEVGCHAAVGKRDGRCGGRRERRAESGDDGHRHVRSHAREQFLAPAAENERVTALQPDYSLPGVRSIDEHRVDLVLGQIVPMRRLAAVNDLDVAGQRGQQPTRCQPIDDDARPRRQRGAGPAR